MAVRGRRMRTAERGTARGREDEMRKPTVNGALASAFGAALAALPPQAWAQASGSAARGAEIAGRWCVSCHVTGTGGRATDAGPTFAEVARTRSPDYLRGFLANPHARGVMPPIELARDDVEDVIAYLQTLK